MDRDLKTKGRQFEMEINKMGRGWRDLKREQKIEGLGMRWLKPMQQQQKKKEKVWANLF